MLPVNKPNHLVSGTSSSADFDHDFSLNGLVSVSWRKLYKSLLLTPVTTETLILFCEVRFVHGKEGPSP